MEGSGISIRISLDPEETSKFHGKRHGTMRTLRPQPSVADLGSLRRSRRLQIDLDGETAGMKREETSMGRSVGLEKRGGIGEQALGVGKWVSCFEE